MHGYNLVCRQFLCYNAITSGGDEKAISYFEVTISTINSLFTTCSISNENENKDNVMFNNMNKNRKKRGDMPSLGLSDKDCVASDASITNIFSTSSNDEVIVLQFQKKQAQ